MLMSNTPHFIYYKTRLVVLEEPHFCLGGSFQPRFLTQNHFHVQLEGVKCSSCVIGNLGQCTVSTLLLAMCHSLITVLFLAFCQRVDIIFLLTPLMSESSSPGATEALIFIFQLSAQMLNFVY